MRAWGWTIAAAILTAQGVAAQGTGTMEVTLAGEDHTFSVLDAEGGTTLKDDADGHVVTLVATPDAGGDPTRDDDGDGDGPRLILAFAVAGTGPDARASEPRITFEDADGRAFASAEGMTDALSLALFSEIGTSFVLSGEFSAELAPQDGDGDALGVSGSFQTTLEGG